MGVARWLRLDLTWSSSDWLVVLSPGARLAWIELLCYTKAIGADGEVKPLGLPAAARKWGIPADDIAEMLEAAKRDGALEVRGNGQWFVSHWAIYQQPDRTGAERQAKWKTRRREVTAGNAVTTTGNGVTTEVEVTAGNAVTSQGNGVTTEGNAVTSQGNAVTSQVTALPPGVTAGNGGRRRYPSRDSDVDIDKYYKLHTSEPVTAGNGVTSQGNAVTGVTSGPDGPDPHELHTEQPKGQQGPDTAGSSVERGLILSETTAIEDLPPECRQILDERWLPHAQLPATCQKPRAMFAILNTLRLCHTQDGQPWDVIGDVVEYAARHWVPAGYMASPRKLRDSKGPGYPTKFEEILGQMQGKQGKQGKRNGKFLPNDPARQYPRDEAAYRPPDDDGEEGRSGDEPTA